MITATNKFFSYYVADGKYLLEDADRFQWRNGHLRKPEVDTDHVAIDIIDEPSPLIEKKGEHDGYYTVIVNEREEKRSHSFCIDTKTGDVRMAQEPHFVANLLGVMAALTPILFVGRVVSRGVRLITLFVGVFFRTFGDVYSNKKEESLPELFVQRFSFHFKEKLSEIAGVWKDFKRDIFCVVPMEVAAIRGAFSSPKEALRMQTIFTHMEIVWNDDADRGKTLLKKVLQFLSVYDSTTEINCKKLKGMFEKLKGMNGAIYLYQCGSPFSEEKKGRVEFYGETFPTYEAFVEHYETQTEVLKQKVESQEKKHQETL